MTRLDFSTKTVIAVKQAITDKHSKAKFGLNPFAQLYLDNGMPEVAMQSFILKAPDGSAIELSGEGDDKWILAGKDCGKQYLVENPDSRLDAYVRLVSFRAYDGDVEGLPATEYFTKWLDAWFVDHS